MSEDSLKKKINTAKKHVCTCLRKVGYDIETASNNTFCIQAARETEYRLIAVGIEEILGCTWFKKQIKRLENHPNPAPGVIKKETWIRPVEEHNFRIYSYKNGQWLDEEKEATRIFDN